MLSKLAKNGVLGGNLRLQSVQRVFAASQSMTNKRCVSTAEFKPNNPLMDSYQSYFTHNPVEGFIRHSPYDVKTTPNLALDQYVWQNVSKWPNHIATVSKKWWKFPSSYLIEINKMISYWYSCTVFTPS